jgi:hypothetical protein
MTTRFGEAFGEEGNLWALEGHGAYSLLNTLSIFTQHAEETGEIC